MQQCGLRSSHKKRFARGSVLTYGLGDNGILACPITTSCEPQEGQSLTYRCHCGHGMLGYDVPLWESCARLSERGGVSYRLVACVQGSVDWRGVVLVDMHATSPRITPHCCISHYHGHSGNRHIGDTRLGKLSGRNLAGQ